jgi:hypothetical protein
MTNVLPNLPTPTNLEPLALGLTIFSNQAQTKASYKRQISTCQSKALGQSTIKTKAAMGLPRRQDRKLARYNNRL